MNVTATWTMPCSLVATRWTPTVTRSTFIMGPRIARLPWLEPAFVPYSSGSTRTEAANAASAPEICDTAWNSPAHVRLPAPSPQPCVHHQATHLPGLLRLWARVRLAGRTCAQAIELPAGRRAENGPQLWSCRLNLDQSPYCASTLIFTCELSCSDAQFRTCHSGCTDREFEQRLLIRCSHS
jgi:hypothetical protein